MTIPSSSSSSSLDSDFESYFNSVHSLHELSQQMSKVSQLFENMDQILSPERTIDRTTGYNFLDQFNSKTITFTCGLLPQLTKPRLPASLLSELKPLSTLGRTSYLPGCSLLLDLFDDYFHDLVKQCRKEKLTTPFTIPEIDGTTSIRDLSYVAHIISRNIQIIMGILYNLMLSEGNHWRRSIKLNRFSEMEVEELKKNILEILNQTEIFVNNVVSPKKLSSWQDLSKALLLFKKIFIDHPTLLFAPTELAPDMSQHFKRLRFRAGHLQDMLENSTANIKILSSSSNQKEYLALFSPTKKFLDQNCIHLTSLLTELSTNEEASKLKKAYQLILNISKESVKDQRALLKHLANIAFDNSLDQSHKMKMLNSLRYILLSIDNVFESLIDESLLTILIHLININHLNEEKMSLCLNNIFHCLQSIQHCEQTKKISEQISIFKQKEDLSLADTCLLTNIENIWTHSFIMISQDLFPVWLEILEKRKNHYNASKNKLEYALTLRDILTLVTIKLPSIFTKLSEEQNIAKAFIELNTYSKELRNLYESIEDQLHLYSQSIFAIQQNVEDLLSTFFEQATQKVPTKDDTVINDSGAQKRNQIMDELLQLENERALTKKKNRGKNKNHRDQTAASTTISPKSKQSTSSSASTSTPIASSSSETSPTQPVTSLEVESPSPSFELFSMPGNLEFSSSQELMDQLLILVPQIKALPSEGSADLSFRTHWKNASLSNLTSTIQQLQETIHNPQFNHNTIFGEINTIRRLIEHTLGIVLTHYLLIDKKGLSPLQQQSNRTHLLHFYTQQIIHHVQGKTVFPAGIRNVVRALQSTPYMLSYANACTNYLFTTAVQKNLSPPAKALVNYLLSVEKGIDVSNKNLSQELLKKHQIVIQQGLLFVHELLKSIVDPQYGVKRYSKEEASIQNPYSEIPNHPQSALTFDEIATSSSSTLTVQESEVKTVHIRDRKHGGIILEEALIWIHVRLLSPVEGTIEKSKRTESRNQHLMNVQLYLKWLKEKLAVPTLHRPYDLCLEVLSLIRRAHKELHLSFLYHGSFYEQNMHIIDREDLRYMNNPCTLNQILRQNSACAAKIPNLEGSSLWLGRVHQILSYPTPLENKPESFVDQSLRVLVKDVKKASKQSRQLSNTEGFKLVVGGGQTLSFQKHQENIEKLIQEQDRLKVFPALGALLQTLRYGISIPQSALSQPEEKQKKK